MQIYSTLDDYEEEYLTRNQRISVGPQVIHTSTYTNSCSPYFLQSIVTANTLGVNDIGSISNLLMEDPIFGSKQKVCKITRKYLVNFIPIQFSTSAINVGCNFCYWAISFRTGLTGQWSEGKTSLTPNVGNVITEMTCLYSQTDTDSRCKQEVERLRVEMMMQSISDGGSYSQYVNTPTCQVNFPCN